MIIYGPASLPTTPLRCCHTYSPYGTLVSHWDAVGSGSDGQPAPSSCHRLPPSFWRGGGAHCRRALLGFARRACPSPNGGSTELAEGSQKATRLPRFWVRCAKLREMEKRHEHRCAWCWAAAGSACMSSRPGSWGPAESPAGGGGAGRVFSAHLCERRRAFQTKPGQRSTGELKQMLKLSSTQGISSKSQSLS